MEIPLLKDIIIIFGLAVLVLILCSKLKIPSLVGFLLTGMIAGPHGLKLITSIDQVEMASQIGIILLLFTIGLEFSLKKLLSLKRYFFIGGILQTVLTILFGMAVAQFLDRPLGESIFLGFLLAMSSTVIALKSFEIYGETHTPHAKVSLGILIFQDIVAVPMIILVPTLSEVQQNVDAAFFSTLLTGIVIVCIVFIAAIKVIPPILYYIAQARNQELFSLSVLMICFAAAWFASSSGLSLAIGAFLAGLLISESEYQHEAVGQMIVLRDLFASLFFVSIGMLLEVQFVIEYPLTIMMLTLGIILMKGSVVAFTTFCLGMPLRTMILAGLALAQIGEFSFVLAKLGMQYGLGTEYYHQLFLAVALLSMGLTPILIGNGQRIVDALLSLPLPEKIKSGLRKKDPKEANDLKDHIVIIGYGIAGRNVAKAAKMLGISYTILEMNPQTVHRERLAGEHIHFGDASHESILQQCNVEQARAVAIMINDHESSRRIVSAIHHINPKGCIIVRTRFLADVKHMEKLGATLVVPDEFGSSLEILSYLFQLYEVSDEKKVDIFSTIRNANLQGSNV